MQPSLHEYQSGTFSAAGRAADVAASQQEGLTAQSSPASTVKLSNCEIALAVPPFPGGRGIDVVVHEECAGRQISQHVHGEQAWADRPALPIGTVPSSTMAGMKALIRRLFVGAIDAQLPVKH